MTRTLHSMLLTGNVFALQIYLTVQGNIVWLATCQDTGVLRHENARAVDKMRISIQARNHAWTVPTTGLCGTATNASPAQVDQTSTPQQADANFAHQDSHTVKSKSDAHALHKHPTCTRTTPVLTASLHIFGTSKQNPVMPVPWRIFMTFLSTNALAPLTLLMKATKSASLVTSLSSGTIRLNSVKSALLHLYLTHKYQNVSVPLIVPMNTMDDASSATSPISGTPKQNSANGALKLLSIKMQAADVSAPPVVLICPMAFALTVSLQDTGIIRTRPVKDARIHLFTIRKDNSVYAPRTSLIFMKADAYLAICRTTGTRALVNASHVPQVSNTTQKQGDVFARVKGRIW